MRQPIFGSLSCLNLYIPQSVHCLNHVRLSFLHCNKEFCCRIWDNYCTLNKKQTLKCEPGWEVGQGNKIPSYPVTKRAFILSSSWLNFRQSSSWLPFSEKMYFRKLKLINPFSAVLRCKSSEKPPSSFTTQECLSQEQRRLINSHWRRGAPISRSLGRIGT